MMDYLPWIFILLCIWFGLWLFRWWDSSSIAKGTYEHSLLDEVRSINEKLEHLDGIHSALWRLAPRPRE